MTLRYGSVCSGIEAASAAWHPLGWTPEFFAEIERFPSEVLAHHYGSNLPGESWSGNAPPNLGDVTRFQEWPDAVLDVLVGGTPCQSFSVAGLRKGLADPRGNLALTYLALADRYRPRWVVWENVPGVLSSNGGRDFGAFLGGLAELGYGWAYRVLDAQHVRVDGFGRAVPQRRRRVFVVGCAGGWRRAGAVLLERDSLSGNVAPRREAGRRTSSTIARSVAVRGRNGKPHVELGEDIANAILTPNGGRAGVGVGAVLTERSLSEVRPINTMVGLRHEALGEGTGLGVGAVNDPAYTLSKCHSHAVQDGLVVRRLTPTECERLQGFPDGYTAIARNGKPAADGPRYKALGNSMAVNVMRWIGRRIEAVEKLEAELQQGRAA